MFQTHKAEKKITLVFFRKCILTQIQIKENKYNYNKCQPKSTEWEKKGLVKLKQDGKVIGKVGLQFGNSLRTIAETFVIKTQSVDILISTQS